MLSTRRSILTGLPDDQVAIKTAGQTPGGIQNLGSAEIQRQGQMKLEIKMNPVFKKKKGKVIELHPKRRVNLH